MTDVPGRFTSFCRIAAAVVMTLALAHPAMADTLHLADDSYVKHEQPDSAKGERLEMRVLDSERPVCRPLP